MSALNLKVMIDGYNLSLEKGTGIATYARNLSLALRDLGCSVDVLYGNRVAKGQDELMREVSFFDNRPPAVGRRRQLQQLQSTLALLNPGFWLTSPTAQPVPLSGRVVARQFESRLPHFDRLYNIHNLFSLATRHFIARKRPLTVRLPTPVDVAHWTFPLPIRVEGAKNIYTIHDLIPLRLPFTTLDNKKLFYRIVSEVAKTADKIVTVSEASRQDIIELLGVEPSRVEVTYQAVDIPATYQTMPEDEVARVVQGTFDLDLGDYLLFVGAMEPKKNLARLIEAYLGSGVTIPLVIAGPAGWMCERELQMITRHGAPRESGRRIHHLEYLSFPQLMHVMRGARALLFPSLYEGFGLPVLEAMTLGRAVMTTRTSSLPEVAGEAALYVDPYSVGEMREAIRALAFDDDLVAGLGEKGRRQAELFNHAAYLPRLEKLYRSLA